MPLLFIVLGQKIGLDVTAATAPEHVFVKYRDEAGNFYNLETTSGANFARDAWMQQQMPMTQQALDNGIYMRPLSKKETVVLMADTLNEFYSQQGQDEKRIALANLELEFYPKFVPAMLHIGAAYYRLLKKNFMSKYPTPKDIPIEARGYFDYLSYNNRLWFSKAEALGWRQPDEETNTKYLQNVNRAKTAQ
jgi:hypothetical protein